MDNLPKTLDETYDRILCTIVQGENADTALQILRWLSYAERPLTTVEVLEVTGIILGDAPGFDDDEMLRDGGDIMRVCPSLVVITPYMEGAEEIYDDNPPEDSTGHSDEEQTSISSEKDTDGNMNHVLKTDKKYARRMGYHARTEYVRLAHFSVKEYLVSSRARVPRFRLHGQESQDILASCCLVYLLRFRDVEWNSHDCETEFPLSNYAARFWADHCRSSGSCSQLQRDLSTTVLDETSPAFAALIRFYDFANP